MDNINISKKDLLMGVAIILLGVSILIILVQTDNVAQRKIQEAVNNQEAEQADMDNDMAPTSSDATTSDEAAE